MLKKYFLLVFILLSINTITFSETKNESQIVKQRKIFLLWLFLIRKEKTTLSKKA